MMMIILADKLTAVGQLMLQHHSAVSQRGAAVAQRHLDAVVHFSSRYIGGDGKHVDSQDLNCSLLPIKNNPND